MIRKQKYFSKPTVCRQMHKHASKKEAKRCDELTQLEKKGAVKHLRQQPVFTLQAKFRWLGRGIRAITYRADFSYYDVGSRKFIVEDVKGYRAETYQIKKKLLIFKMRDREDFLFLET